MCDHDFFRVCRIEARLLYHDAASFDSGRLSNRHGGTPMKVKIVYGNGSSRIIEAEDRKILDAAIILWRGEAFVYKSSTVLLNLPEFVQAKIYTHLD